MILCAIYFRCNNKVVSDNLSWNWECLLMRISIDWLSNLIFWLIWWNYLNRTFYHCLSIKQCFSKSHFHLESIFSFLYIFKLMCIAWPGSYSFAYQLNLKQTWAREEEEEEKDFPIVFYLFVSISPQCSFNLNTWMKTLTHLFHFTCKKAFALDVRRIRKFLRVTNTYKQTNKFTLMID